MRKIRLRNPLTLFVLLVFTMILAPSAMMLKNDDDGDDIDDPGPPDRCSTTTVGLAGPLYLNGLPLIHEDLEVVGDAVKVIVQLPLFCKEVMPPNLPFSWQLTGPAGPVTMVAADTLRPRFRPTVAGVYEAQLTYCPNTCQSVPAGSIRVKIPPQSGSRRFNVVNEIPLPPDTEPELNALALTATTNSVDADHDLRKRKCGGPGSTIGSSQLVPVRPWVNQSSYRLLEGKVMGSNIAGTDNELNHTSHDVHVGVAPDPFSAKLKVPPEGGVEKEDMAVEWESDFFPGPMRPMPGDRISAFGFLTYDCHHIDDRFGILSEIHPAVLTAVQRRRPIRIPDGWGDLGTNIHIPGIVTDIWANKRAGEMTSNCSTTGLHQEYTTRPGQAFPIAGECIKSPHSLDRQFTFNIFLPPNPQKRLAAAGVTAPPAPLYLNIDRASAGARPPKVEVVQTGGVTSLLVTIDLNDYNESEYSARIVAGWVQPSPDNWGLRRWKVGIQSLDILNDHDFARGDDGDWVFWTAINNRDKEWTRLLDAGPVTGFVDFGDRPFETSDTKSPNAARSLGPHLLLFHPDFMDFPGLPQEDLNRSFMIHSSGYDAELRDDATGAVNDIVRLDPSRIPSGTRIDMGRFSDTSDYILNYFVENLGPVPPNLSAAGKALVSAYSLGPKKVRCTPLATAACVLFPERSLEKPWHPVQARQRPGNPELTWRDFPSFEPQEREELGFTGMSIRELAASLAQVRDTDPKSVEQFLGELREEFDRVRGTRMEGEFAKSLPALKANLPADLWQRYFADITPTPIVHPRRWLWLVIIAIIVLVASATFWFFRRPRARIG